MRLVLITGMSGAGKSKAAAAMEDMGYYCVDNLPPNMAEALVRQCAEDTSMERVAVVVDARCGQRLRDVSAMLALFALLQSQGKLTFSLLFLDCENRILYDRYKETRRSHPLVGQDNPRLEDALRWERELMEELRGEADYVVDTTRLTVGQLRQAVIDIFSQEQQRGILVNCMSFGFKHGGAAEADLVFDVRCLPNPFYLEDLRGKTGLDQEVRTYVMESAQSREMLHKIQELLLFLMPLYQKEGKTYLTVAFGCTGGRHRSVTFAYLLGERLEQAGYRVVQTHRDMHKGSHQYAAAQTG